MSRLHIAITLSLVLGAAACSDTKDQMPPPEAAARTADADVRRDVSLPPTAQRPNAPRNIETKTPPAPPTQRPVAPRPSAPAAISPPAPLPVRTLLTGTPVNATIQDGLSSRTNKPDEIVHAVTANDVTDANYQVVIPAGSAVELRIVALEPGSDQVRPAGRLDLAVVSVVVNGRTYPVNATIGPIPHTMQGRGITTDEAARVAGGAAIGAVIGQVIGKNTKGTVIGGAVGTVAGGVVAARYALRDVIVAPGTAIVLSLTSPLEVVVR
jgi:hypothetical protein